MAKKELLEMATSAGLSKRTIDMIVARFGANDGRYKSLEEVGATAGGGITRESVRQAFLRAKKALGAATWGEIEKAYPPPASQASLRRGSRRIKKALRDHFAGGKVGKIDYFDLSERFGFQPTKTTTRAKSHTEEEACMVLYLQFGITFFGKYRMCLSHNNKAGKPLPLGEFYVSEHNAGGRWSICKECNSARKRDWVEKNREKLNEYRREWSKKRRAGGQ